MNTWKHFPNPGDGVGAASQWGKGASDYHPGDDPDCLGLDDCYHSPRRRLRLYRLMKNGVATEAVAKESQLLSRTYHGREWYQMLWEFNANGRRHTLTQRPYYTERVTMGERRTVLYDVKDPNKAVLLDQNTPLMDGSAGTPAVNAFSAARLLLIPFASTLAILASIYLEIVY